MNQPIISLEQASAMNIVTTQPLTNQELTPLLKTETPTKHAVSSTINIDCPNWKFFCCFTTTANSQLEQ